MNELLRRLMSRRGIYMAPAGGDGGDGGGGGGDSEKTPEEIEAEAAAVAEELKKGKPSDAEAKLLKEVMSKKARLEDAEKRVKKAEERATEAAERLKQFEGVDPAEIKKLVDAQRAAETKRLEAAGEWDRLKAQMVEQHQAVLTEKDSKIITVEQQVVSLNTQIADLTVGNAFNSSQFIRDDVAMPLSKVRALYGSHFEFKDGKVVAYDKPAGAAQRTPLVDAAGNPLAFDAALKKIVEADPDKDQLLKSKVAEGARSGTRTRTPAPAARTEELRGKDRIAAGLAKMKQ